MGTNCSSLKKGLGAMVTFATSREHKLQIKSQPQDQKDVVGTVTFTVEAIGTDLVYLWEREEGNIWKPLPEFDRIQGSNTDTLTITGLKETDGGRYRCNIGNFAGSISSEPANLTVVESPRITTQPQSQIAFSRATFTVEATGTDLVYLWEREEGSDWKPLPELDRIQGSNKATLTIGDLTEADGGRYWCIIRNRAGSISSEPANLTVAMSPQITFEPQDQTAFNTVTFTIQATGTDLVYRWEREEDGDWKPLPELDRIQGSNSATLTIGELNEADGGRYRCNVSNLVGCIASEPANLTVVEPPLITIQPQDQTAFRMETSFTVEATGTDLVYCWEHEEGRDWKPLPELDRIQGSNSATLTISELTEADEGRYRCNVSNLADCIASEPTYLTIVQPPHISTQPKDQTAFSTVTFTVEATGTHLDYHWEREEGSDWKPLPELDRIQGSNTATLTITGLNEADGGKYQCIISNLAGNISSKPAKLTAAEPPKVMTPPQNQTNAVGMETSFTVEATGTDLVYRWEREDGDWKPLPELDRIQGKNKATLTITGLTEADGGMYHCIVSNLTGCIASEPAVLTVVEPPEITTQPQDQTSTVTFTVQATGSNLVYHWERKLHDDREWHSLPKLDRIQGSNANILTIGELKETDEGRYRCIVSNLVGIISTKPASLTVVEPPQITTQPQHQTDTVGTVTSFIVQATGTGTNPLAYHWERKLKLGGNVWEPLSSREGVQGDDTDTLIMDGIKKADEGMYRCVVHNSIGVVQSKSAYLTAVGQGIPYGCIIIGATLTVVAGIQFIEDLTVVCSYIPLLFV